LDSSTSQTLIFDRSDLCRAYFEHNRGRPTLPAFTHEPYCLYFPASH